jgi:hypothetical protein
VRERGSACPARALGISRAAVKSRVLRGAPCCTIDLSDVARSSLARLASACLAECRVARKRAGHASRHARLSASPSWADEWIAAAGNAAPAQGRRAAYSVVGGVLLARRPNVCFGSLADTHDERHDVLVMCFDALYARCRVMPPLLREQEAL